MWGKSPHEEEVGTWGAATNCSSTREAYFGDILKVSENTPESNYLDRFLKHVLL